MSNLSIKERKRKFNKLYSSLNIKLIKGNKKDIQYMVDYINKGKSLKTKSYCGELPSGILSYCGYIDLQKMKLFSVR